MDHIRNFSIVAHIDHGKTTLTDRLLLATNTISEREFRERIMDSNPIEQERGITIKMAPVRMETKVNGTKYVLNLIDTPGHVDFSYEVSRSLLAVEGVLLLVDATQGIQAQTLSHYYSVVELGLPMIPVINKVDLPNADVDGVMLAMMEDFGFDEDEFVLTSAKTGEGVDKLISKIITNIPQPNSRYKESRALVFNSYYDEYKGVIAAVRVFDGTFERNMKLKLMAADVQFDATELGIYTPAMKQVETLAAGEVGYVATGLKSIGTVSVGDTLTQAATANVVKRIAGYQKPQLMVYLDLYPIDGDEFTQLVDAMEKLTLHDASLAYSPVNSKALGNGLRVGFLGILHAEIVQERLEREYGMDLIATAPTVMYQIRKTNGELITITNPSDLPDPTYVKTILEPVAATTIYVPRSYMGMVMQLCEEHRGTMKGIEYIGSRVRLNYTMPLAEIIVRFFDDLKSVSSGYASIEYKVIGYEEVDAVKLSIIINHEPIEALSRIVVADQAERIGREIVDILKDEIPRQLFQIPIQAAIGSKIVARANVKAFRKDVTSKLYGGDATRRKKLLEKQKKGKARRKQFGSVEIPQQAFMNVLRRRE